MLPVDTCNEYYVLFTMIISIFYYVKVTMTNYDKHLYLLASILDSSYILKTDVLAVLTFFPSKNKG
jgi:hypothetical protein